MALKFIVGIGWIDPDPEVPNPRGGLVKVDAPDPTTVGTDNGGNLVTGDLIYTPATEGQYGAAVNGVTPDPNARVNTPEWVAYNFPEYIDNEGKIFTTGAKTIYSTLGGKPGDVGYTTITGTRGSSGMKNPWEGFDQNYWQQLGDEERKSYFDSINWFRNEGQGIDPRLISGMTMDDPYALGQLTASNQYGTLTFGSGVSARNPYGLNATFKGKDYEGKDYNWQQQWWGHVQQRPGGGEKYVPGWGATAGLIGDPSYVPADARNLWYDNSGQFPAPPWSSLEPGTNITGRYGWPDSTANQQSTGFSAFGT